MGGQRGTGAQWAAAYKALLEYIFLLLPMTGALYLWMFQPQPLVWQAPLIYAVLVAVGIVLPLFSGWVSWRCYGSSGECSQRNIAIALVAFAVLYAPHLLLIPAAQTHQHVLLIFGPLSRLVLTGWFCVALWQLGQEPETHQSAAGWGQPVAIVLLLLLAGVGLSLWDAALPLSQLAEGAALLLALVGIVGLRRQASLSRLMWNFQAAAVSFACASFSFLLSDPWTHLWWYAHAGFSAGFFILSHGLMRAFLTTRSITQVYSEEEMAARLAISEAGAAALHAAQARLESLLESCPIGIMVTDMTGIIRYCNPQQGRMFHLPTEQVEGRNVRDFLIHPEDAPHDSTPDLLFLDDNEPVEQEFHRPDGSQFHGLVSRSPILFDGKQAVVEWSLDITERHQAAEAMRLATHLAEIANRAKTDFLASMSHELRTPLNAISGFTEMMQSEMLGPLGHEAYREYCRFIMDSTRHLTDLINDVLDVAAVETGKVELFDRRVTVDRLMDAVSVMMDARVRQKQQSLVREMPPGLPALMVDERRIKQVLANLLTNAVKFTPHGGTITLRAWVEPGGDLVMAVSDTGVGMTELEQKQVLIPFAQARNGMVRENDGVGIGLPLAHSLMKLHGGMLDIDSLPGQGTTVRLTFPSWRCLPVRG